MVIAPWRAACSRGIGLLFGPRAGVSSDLPATLPSRWQRVRCRAIGHAAAGRACVIRRRSGRAEPRLAQPDAAGDLRAANSWSRRPSAVPARRRGSARLMVEIEPVEVHGNLPECKRERAGLSVAGAYGVRARDRFEDGGRCANCNCGRPLRSLTTAQTRAGIAPKGRSMRSAMTAFGAALALTRSHRLRKDNGQDGKAGMGQPAEGSEH